MLRISYAKKVYFPVRLTVIPTKKSVPKKNSRNTLCLVLKLFIKLKQRELFSDNSVAGSKKLGDRSNLELRKLIEKLRKSRI